MIDGFDTNMLIQFHLIWLGPVALALFRSVRQPTNRRVKKWMSGRGLDPMGAEREVVERHLYRSRWFRSVGFIAGWSYQGVELWSSRSGYGVWGFGLYVATLIGFSVGVVLGEITTTRQPGTVATLEPRHIGQYVPDLGIASPEWLSMAPVALGIYAFLVTEQPAFIAWGAGAPAAAWAMRAAIHYLVHRPQTVDSPAEVRADDALKSWSAQAIMGVSYTSVAVFWVQIASLLSNVQATSASRSWAYQALGISIGIVTIFIPGLMWGFISDRAKWVVPRTRTQ